MKHTLIRVYEHESLKIGEKGFTENHFDLLARYLGDSEGEDFPYYSLIHRGIRMKQYVGVLKVGDVQIEVLPKADRCATEQDKDKWESFLLTMLQSVFRLKVNLPTKADQQIRSNRVLDVFLQHFLDEVEQLMHKGLVKAYRRVESHNTSLKGRLVMSKHLTQNMVHKERFFVEYTTYDRNHLFNRIIYRALKTIPDIAANSYTAHRAKSLAFEFPELNDVVVNSALFERLAFDRKTEDYREAMELARLILLNYMPSLNHREDNSVLALMFDMNMLWEEYVYVLLRKACRGTYKVLAQNTKRFWYSDAVGNKTIRPDIVVMDGQRCLAVLDTKWKCPKDGRPSDADLKQMFVYHKYWKTEHTALLYPGANTNMEGTFYKYDQDSSPLKCALMYLPIVAEPEHNVQLDITRIAEMFEKSC